MEGPEAGPRLEAEGGDFLPFLALLHRVMRLATFLSFGLLREGEGWASEISLAALILSAYTEVCSVLETPGQAVRTSAESVWF